MNKWLYSNVLLLVLFWWEMAEHELSVVFSVPSSLYSSLFLILKSAPELYTTCRLAVKNIFGDVRTIQDENGFVTQRKTILRKRHVRYMYRHTTSLALLLDVRETTSLEVDCGMDDVEAPVQILRDFIYCRRTGIRIAVERHYNDYHDPNVYQMDYDSFNRYKYDCRIHIEWEAEDIERFVQVLNNDDIVYRLFEIMSKRNLNNVGDEIINIQNMNLIHPYGHGGNPHHMKFFSLKYDGVRKNFCIFGKYMQISGGKTYTFDNHWFGQAIVGHCELMGDAVIIIDIYLVAEDFYKLAKKYNMSYTCVLQNYHQFAEGGGCKTQDEYFHGKRLRTNIEFLNPCQAIDIIQLLKTSVWPMETKLGECVRLQSFFTAIPSLRMAVDNSEFKIDGCLGYDKKQIYKFKENPTIDLIFKFDEMYRTICKRMKSNQHEMKKLVQFINIQKSCNWLEFEKRFPGKFNRFAGEFLYFSHNRNFAKHYKNWCVDIDLDVFTSDLKEINCTSFVLLLEFDVCPGKLVYNRLRNDKFSANSIHVFKDINKVFKKYFVYLFSISTKCPIYQCQTMIG